MISPKIYKMSHHQNKGNAFRSALNARGWHESQYRYSNHVKFGLFDADWRPQDIEDLKGKPYFLYPHAARPMVQYDGSVKPRQDCRTMFVSAPAGVYLMEKIGYPCEVVEVGWSLTPVKQFQPCEDVENITFAPIHPNANGYLNEIDKNLNKQTYERLLKYVEKHEDVIMTVRFCRDINDNGLGEEFSRQDPGIVWKQANPDSSTDDITRADLVVGHQTFAYMSVALGVPTVMMGEDIAPRSGNADNGFSYSAHFEDYKDYLMFPLDILNGDTEKLIQTAITGSVAVEDWKQRFIGSPFRPDYFVDCIEERL